MNVRRRARPAGRSPRTRARTNLPPLAVQFIPLCRDQRDVRIVQGALALRSLLRHLADDSAGRSLLESGGRAFVSASLRPYVLAALADEDEGRPALIVAGDDRQARDLAADIKQWLAPPRGPFSPSRGVAYESHLAPPPHLVGLRVAALDAL